MPGIALKKRGVFESAGVVVIVEQFINGTVRGLFGKGRLGGDLSVSHYASLAVNVGRADSLIGGEISIRNIPRETL